MRALPAVLPRTYVVYQRALMRKEEMPELVYECAVLSQAKRFVLTYTKGKQGVWIAKNGRSAHYYSEHRDETMLVWIKRKRMYP